MRIAVYHNQPHGGARRALHGFGCELARRHQVDVVTLSSSDQSLSDHDYAQRVTVLPYQPRRPVPGGAWLNDWLQRRSLSDLRRACMLAARKIDEGGYDVALVDADRYTYAPFLLGQVRTPTVYYCHHGPWRTDGGPWRPRLSRWQRARAVWHGPFEASFEKTLRSVDWEATRAAGAVVTNSRYTAGRIRDVYGIAAGVCPPGVRLPEAAEPEGLHLLSVGVVEAHKGHELVVQAVAQLAEPRPPLHIVGGSVSTSEGGRLEALAGRLGVRLSVREAVTEEALESEFRGASVFLYGARQEPLGLAPLEAMARSLPVVAVGEGGVLETVEDGRTGFLVAPQPAAFAAALARLLEDPGLRRRMGEEGRRRVATEWNWAARAAALEAVLESKASPVLVPS